MLLARAADEVEALTYRAALEERNIRYTTSRSSRQYPMVTVGPLAETLFFVAEVDVEAARQAIEEVGNDEASTISAEDVAREAVPGEPPEDDTGPDQQEPSASSTAGSGVSGGNERRDVMPRLLLYSATISLFLGAVSPGTSVPIGVTCLLLGVVLAALGLRSRRDS